MIEIYFIVMSDLQK